MSSPGRAPWRPGDIPAVLVLNVLALVGVGACWFGSAQEVRFHDTLYWLQGAIVASVVAAVGNGVFLLAGMHRLRARRRALVEEWPRVPASRPAVREVAVVTAPRMTTYHRPTCLLVLGKQVRSGSASALARRHLAPCGMCRP